MREVRVGDALLVHGDALESLRALPADSLAAIVSDPQYGIGYVHGTGGLGGKSRTGVAVKARRRNSNRPVHGDDKPFDPMPLLNYGLPTLLFGADHYRDRLPNGGTWIAWDKSPGGIGPADDFADGEFAWTNVRKIKRNVLRFLWKGIACVKEGEDNGRRWHPTQKPVGLMMECLRLLKLTPGSGAVADPYMGSGSTGVACCRLGLPFFGVEIDPDHFAVAVERISEAADSGPLLANLAPAAPDPTPLFAGLEDATA